MKTAEVEVFVLVDADGNWVASDDQAALLPRYDEVIVERDDEVPTPYRVIRVVLTVPLPVVPTLTGTVPADGGAVLSVA